MRRIMETWILYNSDEELTSTSYTVFETLICTMKWQEIKNDVFRNNFHLMNHVDLEVILYIRSFY